MSAAENEPGALPRKPFLAAATAFSSAANELFDLIEETEDVEPITKIKSFGKLIGMKHEAFAAHDVTGSDFAAARRHADPPPDVAESFGLLDAIEQRWSSMIGSLEKKVAHLEQSSPQLKKGEAVADFCLPTAAGTDWRLSAQKGTNILLVVLRHFG